jgi:hypothetical protein
VIKFTSFDGILSAKKSMNPSTPKFKTGSLKIIMAPYGIRQLLAGEVEKERMRRSDFAKASRIKNVFGQKTKSRTSSPSTVGKSPVGVRKLEPVNRSKIKRSSKVVISIPLMCQPLKDFFGRPVAAEKVAERERVREERERVAHDTISFKFAEGFSDAVRKPCFMKDLF